MAEATLAAVRVEVALRPLLARAAVAAALHAIAPPAALLALIETGPGKDVGCRPPAA